jgi:hypothetical protein
LANILVTDLSLRAVCVSFTGIRYTDLFIATHARLAAAVIYAFWHSADAGHATLA